MKIVIFGLSITSSWGNGHASLWRGLCRALAERGHSVDFFERDVPYYAQARDEVSIEGTRIHLYSDWSLMLPTARQCLADSDAGIITSYCPDAIAASELVCGGKAISVFYDMDSPVTLRRIQSGTSVEYLPADGLARFELVLSYAGGLALSLLKTELRAQNVAPLYGWADPKQHSAQPRRAEFRGDLSYLGTYSEDRQESLQELLLEPAAQTPGRKFVLAGSQYPASFPWLPNVYFVRHLSPREHGAFYNSSPMTLNVTRRAMLEMGYCPSGRIFEAAACQIPVLSDYWDGLEEFFVPGEEILVARDRHDTMAALDMAPEALARIGRAAYERTLSDHTASARAVQLELILESARKPATVPA
ncbi:MAG: glycosyltransferase [Bryobacterales bacterium]|nr:glycosyltransferase [Bryobacterales bacterium]